MTDRNDIDGLELQLDALGQTVAETTGVTAAFESELARAKGAIGETGAEISGLSRGMTSGLRSAFNGVIFDGEKLSDSLEGLAKSMSNAVYNAAIAPVANQVGGLVSGAVNGMVSAVLPFENGAPFSQGRVMPFAKGGVVSGPVSFPMRSGVGLMGEAGPEAIMPLRRGADGRLGVAASGGGRPVTVVMNVNTPDAESFSRSRGQIAAQMGRIISRGARNS